MATSPSGTHVATTPYSYNVYKTGHTVTLTTLTQIAGTATATKVGHGFRDGDTVTHAGAAQAGYNIAAVITVVDADSYTFTVAGGTVSPATGTITATGADQAVFNSDTLASDTQLTLSVAANEVYLADFTLFYSNTDDTGSGIKATIAAPTGAKGYFWVVSDFVAATPAVAFGTTVTLSNSLNATVQVRKFRAFIKNGSTAGSLLFKFAQSTAAPATEVAVYAGSYINATQQYDSVVF